MYTVKQIIEERFGGYLKVDTSNGGRFDVLKDEDGVFRIRYWHDWSVDKSEDYELSEVDWNEDEMDEDERYFIYALLENQERMEEDGIRDEVEDFLKETIVDRYMIREIIRDGVFDGVECNTENGGHFEVSKDADDVYCAYYWHDWERSADYELNEVRLDGSEMTEDGEYFIERLLENLPTMEDDDVRDEVEDFLRVQLM